MYLASVVSLSLCFFPKLNWVTKGDYYSEITLTLICEFNGRKKATVENCGQNTKAGKWFVYNCIIITITNVLL